MRNNNDTKINVEKHNDKNGSFQIKNKQYASIFNLEANEVKVFDLNAVEFNQIVSGPERETELVGTFNLKTYKKFAGRKRAKEEIKAVKKAVNEGMSI